MQTLPRYPNKRILERNHTRYDHNQWEYERLTLGEGHLRCLVAHEDHLLRAEGDLCTKLKFGEVEVRRVSRSRLGEEEKLNYTLLFAHTCTPRH